MSTSVIQHNPQLITQGYLGERVPVGITRIAVLFSSNLAPSYIPEALQTSLPTKDPKALKIQLSMDVEKRVIKFLVTNELLFSLQDDLKNHMRMRVQLFLQQLLLVYKTRLNFDFYPRADFQAGEVPKKKDDVDFIPYVAAHCGTSPTLRLTDKEREYLTESSVSFAKGTYFYNTWNTTVYLPACANLVDSNIDRHVLPENQLNLRGVANKLLNQVSSGEINPEEGLIQFLKSLQNALEIIEQTETDEIKRIVIFHYSLVINSCLESIEGGYPFIQKFCFKSMLEKIDESFFMQVQKDLHGCLKQELETIKPGAIPRSILPADINLRYWQQQLIAILPKINSPTTQQYIKICCLSERVKAAATDYLRFLHSDATKGNEDIVRILQIKTPKTINRLGLSGRALALHNEALLVINKKHIMNMPYVLLVNLLRLVDEFLALVPASRPAGRDRNTFCNVIDAHIAESNLALTPTAGKSIQTCKNALKVQQAAEALFNQLHASPAELQKSELSSFLGITPATVNSKALSPIGTTFYSAVLEHICTTGDKTNPRNMDVICLRLLADLNRWSPSPDQ